MEGRRLYILTGVQILGVGVLFWILVTGTGPWNAERYVGTALAAVGVSGIAVARYQLGKSFSIGAQAHKLVTTGIYSKIRNPIYVSGGVMIAGLGLVLQKSGMWVVLFALIVGQTVRARREARVLEAAFGDEYREYRLKTWF
jgi:protein-S-isoprenylcysteine O-methyltransferase Ste14